jgi:Translation elongation factors (GTPases)
VLKLTTKTSLIDDPKQSSSENHDQQALLVRDLCDKIAYAFQLATGQGPLCQEPMQGIAVFLEDLTVHTTSNDELDMGRLTGDAIRLVREGISQGFLDWSPRIMLAMYSCEIQATSKSKPSPFDPSTIQQSHKIQN